MNINIKLSKPKFLALAELLNMLAKTPIPKDQEGKMIKSAMSKITLKVQKKQLELINQQDLFNEKKNVKISLEYFEAYYIDAFIGIVRSNPQAFPVKFDDYQKNALLQISTELNQKLS